MKKSHACGKTEAMGLKTSVAVALLSAAVLCPRAAQAMEIQMFDDMAIQDQRDYLTFLVKHAQKVFTEQGRPDLAAKVRQLFREERGDDHRSPGSDQFEKNLAIQRDFIVRIATEKLPFTRPLVENALIMTFYRNGIPTSFAFSRGLVQALREKPYWPKLPLQRSSLSNRDEAGSRPGSGSSLSPES